jgi:hypothetical protein
VCVGGGRGASPPSLFVCMRARACVCECMSVVRAHVVDTRPLFADADALAPDPLATVFHTLHHPRRRLLCGGGSGGGGGGWGRRCISTIPTPHAPCWCGPTVARPHRLENWCPGSPPPPPTHTHTHPPTHSPNSFSVTVARVAGPTGAMHGARICACVRHATRYRVVWRGAGCPGHVNTEAQHCVCGCMSACVCVVVCAACRAMKDVLAACRKSRSPAAAAEAARVVAAGLAELHALGRGPALVASPEAPSAGASSAGASSAGASSTGAGAGGHAGVIAAAGRTRTASSDGTIGGGGGGGGDGTAPAAGRPVVKAWSGAVPSAVLKPRQAAAPRCVRARVCVCACVRCTVCASVHRPWARDPADIKSVASQRVPCSVQGRACLRALCCCCGRGIHCCWGTRRRNVGCSRVNCVPHQRCGSARTGAGPARCQRAVAAVSRQPGRRRCRGRRSPVWRRRGGLGPALCRTPAPLPCAPQGAEEGPGTGGWRPPAALPTVWLCY